MAGGHMHDRRRHQPYRPVDVPGPNRDDEQAIKKQDRDEDQHDLVSNLSGMHVKASGWWSIHFP